MLQLPQMMHAVIFLNGNSPEPKDIKKYIKKSDFIICADGGAEYALVAGLTPDIVLGDFDSLTQKFQKKIKELQIPVESFPTEKDFTDSELAIAYALKKGYRDLLFFGVTGTRIDHFLANITHLAMLAEDGIAITIIDNHQIIYLTSYELEVKGKKGDYLSLIPIEKNVQGVTTRGLKWELYDDTLEYGATRGVSNEFIKSSVRISVKKGVLLVIHQRQKD